MGIPMSMPTILVVDDCQSVRLTVQRTLTSAGYTVAVACDGDDALEKLTEEIGLIVLDINMPGLDGYGFCERMAEKDPGHEDVPIVFLTSEKSKALSMLGGAMGGYLKKPACEEELLAVVKAQLQKVQSERQLKQGHDE